MPLHYSDSLLVLLLTVIFLGLLVELSRFDHRAVSPTAPRGGPRPLRPRTPDDCPHCREAATVSPTTVAQAVVPYALRKSRRGRNKMIATRGYACPHRDCEYCEITDPAVHALVGHGHHRQAQLIQDLYCQACRPLTGVFRSARRHTALYGLKTSAARVAQVLHAVAEGLSPHAAARVFNLSETTVRFWLMRAGLHSRSLHDRFLRALQLAHV